MAAVSHEWPSRRTPAHGGDCDPTGLLNISIPDRSPYLGRAGIIAGSYVLVALLLLRLAKHFGDRALESRIEG